ncbi:hypothetical protein Smp_187170 [Schistosoma mansoni]|nr:hypothetical protein Smp_187170 [Schistosoma mansoni]|eukprot:XP_018649411.1 hypothetical protein Smp_187170 [Schistosoma mansoni]
MTIRLVTSPLEACEDIREDAVDKKVDNMNLCNHKTTSETVLNNNHNHITTTNTASDNTDTSFIVKQIKRIENNNNNDSHTNKPLTNGSTCISTKCN